MEYPPAEDWRNEYSRRGQQWIQDHFIRILGKSATNPELTPVYNDSMRAWDSATNLRQAIDNLAEIADRHLSVAREKERQGLDHTAFAYYYRATSCYLDAQWAILDEHDTDKVAWHGQAMEAFDKVIELNPNYEMEKVDIQLPFHDEPMPAVFHNCGEEVAPAVLLVPGMDRTKEQTVNPLGNYFKSRGYHTLAIDGPGQGEARMRGICDDDYDTYQRAGRAAIDWLVNQDVVDDKRIGIRGNSMGSYWAPRIAYEDDRLSAMVVEKGCWYSKDLIFNQAQPFFKKRFMWMAGIYDEEEFDEYAEDMTLEGIDEDIEVPTLIIHGEYDELQTREQAKLFYERLAGPKRLQLYEDQFHTLGHARPDFEYDIADWFSLVWEGEIPEDYEEAVLVPDYPTGGYIASPKFDFINQETFSGPTSE